MGRRLRGPGSPAQRRLAELGPTSEFTITVTRDTGDRVRAIMSKTGETPGQVFERLAAPQLGGVRVASVPDRLMPPGWQGGTVEKSEGGEAGETAPRQAGEGGESLTSTDTPSLVGVGGAEEGGRPPLPSSRPSAAEARARVAARAARKAG